MMRILCKAFRNIYKIEVKGQAYEGKAAKEADDMLRLVVASINETYNDRQASISVIETKGEYDAKRKKVRVAKNGKQP